MHQGKSPTSGALPACASRKQMFGEGKKGNKRRKKNTFEQMLGGGEIRKEKKLEQSTRACVTKLKHSIKTFIYVNMFLPNKQRAAN